jgi:integral membrane protein
MTASLIRFRVAAYVVGCWLLLLVGVAMPLKYLADRPTLTEIVSPIHGVLYIGYIIVTVLLARRLRWSPSRTVGVLLAGTIPFMSFWVERKVVSWVHAVKQDTQPTTAR